MYTAKEQLLKDPAEELRFNFNFRPNSQDGIETGEVIKATPAPTIATVPSTDLLVDQVLLSGDKVQARYRAGLAGVTYHVTCTVTTELALQEQIKKFCGDLVVEAC
jgi:hypothetical protein